MPPSTARPRPTTSPSFSRIFPCGSRSSRMACRSGASSTISTKAPCRPRFDSGLRTESTLSAAIRQPRAFRARRAGGSLFHRSQATRLQGQKTRPGDGLGLLEIERLDPLPALDDLLGRDPDLGHVVLRLAEMRVELGDALAEAADILQELLDFDLDRAAFLADA